MAAHRLNADSTLNLKAKLQIAIIVAIAYMASAEDTQTAKLTTIGGSQAVLATSSTHRQFPLLDGSTGFRRSIRAASRTPSGPPVDEDQAGILSTSFATPELAEAQSSLVSSSGIATASATAGQNPTATGTVSGIPTEDDGKASDGETGTIPSSPPGLAGNIAPGSEGVGQIPGRKLQLWVE